MNEYIPLVVFAVACIVIPLYRTYRLRVESRIPKGIPRYKRYTQCRCNNPKVRAKYNRNCNYC